VEKAKNIDVISFIEISLYVCVIGMLRKGPF